jgi:hypothetical protein
MSRRFPRKDEPAFGRMFDLLEAFLAGDVDRP